MRIGELAKQTGLSRDTIRFYERNGLLSSSPGPDASNNYRDYPEDSLRWLAFVTAAREAGLSVADLRGISEAMDGACGPEAGQAVIKAKIEELRGRAAQIDRSIAFLTAALERGPDC